MEIIFNIDIVKTVLYPVEYNNMHKIQFSYYFVMITETWKIDNIMYICLYVSFQLLLFSMPLKIVCFEHCHAYI